MGLCQRNMIISTLSSKLLVPFATKLSLVVLHHMPECPVETMDYCIQGQGHSSDSNCLCMFVCVAIVIAKHFVFPHNVCETGCCINLLH